MTKALKALIIAASFVVTCTTSLGQAAAPAGGGRPAYPPVRIGPPAPVPPSVTMLRPSAEELTEINAALKRHISSDKSQSAPVLKKYESLIMLQPPRLNTAATFTQTTQRMGARHEGFVATAKAGNIDLLLHGDSITDWWVQNDDNKKIFQKYFGNIRTANFAVAGDTTQGVLWGLQNGEGQGFQPKAVMLMIGTNNMGANTAPEIAEGIGAVVVELRRNFPEAKILLLAIFRAVCPAIRCATRSPRRTGSSQNSTIRSTSSTWISARSSLTHRASFCPTLFVLIISTRWRRAMTFGVKPCRRRSPSC